MWNCADDPEDDMLGVAATVDGMHIDVSIWCKADWIMELAKSCGRYPIEPPVRLGDGWGETVGSWKHDVSAYIEIEPAGSFGQLIVVVQVNNRRESHAKRLVADSAAHLEFLTSYGQLAAFSRELVMMIEGTLDVAELRSDVLA